MSQRQKKVDQDLNYNVEVTDVRREASLDYAKHQKKLDKAIARP
jgi:DNA-dependent RNA polymerase auxiliary subunit epsilon